LRYIEKDKSNETGYSGNMLDFPVNKEERVLVHILVTKFHIEPAIDSQLEFRLNPTMKDLVINRPAAKKKRSKQQKEESMDETTESVGENQPVWLDSLEEIVKMK
jgi:hypothetical protein